MQPPVQLFARRLGERVGAPVAVTPELERAVGAAWDAGRSAWPRVSVAAERFAIHLASKIDESSVSITAGNPDSVARELLAWKQVADLYLACACADGDPVALDAFETRYLAGLGSVVGRFEGAGLRLDEIQQAVREKLFVPEEGASATIALYGGRGPLASWVFVVAARVALNLLRAHPRPLASSEEKLLGLSAPAADQELAYFQRLYKETFATALKDALEVLPARDRTLLRQHYVDGVTLKQLASVHGVHRVTLVNWVTQAREALRDETHALLLERLGISERTLGSIARLVQSQFGLSVQRILLGADKPTVGE